MLRGLSSAARFLLLLVMNPNLLLLIKNIRIVKVDGNRALEFTTYSRKAVTREFPVNLPRPPPPLPPPRQSLLRRTAPALAAISAAGGISATRRQLPPPLAETRPLAGAVAELFKPAAAAQPATQRAEARERGKPRLSLAGGPRQPDRAVHLPLLMTAIGAAAAARGLLLPSHLKVDVALPPLLEAACGLGLPLLADAALGAPAALLCALLLCGSAASPRCSARATGPHSRSPARSRWPARRPSPSRSR